MLLSVEKLADVGEVFRNNGIHHNQYVAHSNDSGWKIRIFDLTENMLTKILEELNAKNFKFDLIFSLISNNR